MRPRSQKVLENMSLPAYHPLPRPSRAAATILTLFTLLTFTLPAASRPDPPELSPPPAASEGEPGQLADSGEEKSSVTVAETEAPVAQNIDLKEVVSDPAEIRAVADPPAVTAAESALAAAVQPAVDEVTKPALVLLSASVSPGTTTRLAWSPDVSFLGVSAPTSVLVVNGVKPGPTVCLTAAVHGDEINGIETVRRLLYSMDAEKLSGTLIGVPIVNLQGFRSGSRYLADRRDLNRFFPGSESGSAASRIAFSFFNEVISRCDMLIDLHTGSFRRTNLPQLRADLSYPGVQELSQQMGRIVVVQSKGAKGSLRRAATERGIPAVTLEAGAPNELDRDVVEQSVSSVETALGGLGLLETRRSRRRSNAPVYYQSTWVRASDGGILISESRLGEVVKAGQLLGVVTNPITNERSEINSPLAGRLIGMALNQVMHPGFAAYHLGINPARDPAVNAEELPNGAGSPLDLEDDEDPDNDENAPLETLPPEMDADIDMADEADESGR